MKRIGLLTAIFSTITLLSSCEVIGGIFKAGVWSGIIVVVIVIALIIWLISKFMGGRRG
jgi:ABC-type enterobactin transport system permease subunit